MRIFKKRDLRICLLIVLAVAVVWGGGRLLLSVFLAAENSPAADDVSSVSSEAVPVVASSEAKGDADAPSSEGSLSEAVVSSETVLSEEKAGWGQLWSHFFAMATGISLEESDFPRWQSILSACLPWRFSREQEEDELIFHYAAGDESSYFWNQNEDTENPLVAIYSTHSAESYTPYSGQPSVSGSRGGVYVASSVVAETLAKENIGTVVDDTIHDSPNWNKSYSNSLATAQKLLNTYPSIKILIDMHRDAGVSKENTTVEINGKKAARIMFVVGSNQRYEHPYWEQNLSFAEQIGEKMEELYPGLLRTVKVQNGRYNQHVSTHSVLVEMGATENTIEEVEYSASMLAEVLAEVLRKME